MEIFGVGPLEFILILVLALVILGPEDMVGTARKIGQWVYRVVRSPTWRSIMATSQDLRELPQKIVRDAGLEETMKEIKQTASDVKTDLDQTTRQISTEMQAATVEVNREMQIAASDANEGMKEAGVEAQAAMNSAAAGLAEGEHSIMPLPGLPQGLPAQVQPEGSAPLEAAPAVVDESQLHYATELDAIASGLGGQVISAAEPEENSIFHVTPAAHSVPVAPAEETQAEVSSEQFYTGELQTFAQALGESTGSPQAAHKAAIEGLAPWAIGIPVGLDLNSADTMEARLKKRMEEMEKSIEKLSAKQGAHPPQAIEPAAGEGQPSTPPLPEESAPPAAPVKVRRSAKRNPAAETAEGETPRAAPRKRAAKATPPTAVESAETAADEAPKPAPRKRAAKAGTSQTAETPSEEAPKPAPHKRAAKKTPVPETAPQDSSPTQA